MAASHRVSSLTAMGLWADVKHSGAGSLNWLFRGKIGQGEIDQGLSQPLFRLCGQQLLCRLPDSCEWQSRDGWCPAYSWSSSHGRQCPFYSNSTAPFPLFVGVDVGPATGSGLLPVVLGLISSLQCLGGYCSAEWWKIVGMTAGRRPARGGYGLQGHCPRKGQ